MDANYMWGYTPNVFDYHNSVITCDANGHTIEQTDEGDGNAQANFTVPLTFEFQIAPELRAVVRSVCSV